ncbi:hypothetical protein C923_05751 [Plasmodium falciparum UGT5.1]|uniref:ATPase AAA-type core domain-containing protein n=8 Tax=Plasmodium falciparum TaxID=5833 RepID=A0A024VZA2_PLAFA|nr:hypothetical protein PFFVO_05271 [Plasmodium falciparum Vietnam Oak-Knoll (FVO)]ETW33648.1 hypothetical protein PFTANZ_05615 [Plasmodium falciparum Tanzania (2000708)]ETW39613.1 hypothetical protein PFNF135_05643 [Plasmodium falciparum NF135/5.C10]EUR62489.1 hypothetical protein PFBG_05699 [Plasmodium falciparum 7G8]EWC73548.1 hypothetical protein C923_05751 [Plasmodium falciparum UGT5.1]KNC37195.1 hypothetical protein PFLG_02364 [Plasmodium falciparum RAJ116]KNG76993.1 hypothetical protei
MINCKRKIHRRRNIIQKLTELLQNNKNLFVSIQCYDNNSYEIYNNLIEYIKLNLDLSEICIIDIISIYNCNDVSKFLKDVFYDFTKYIKRNKIYKSAIILPYFDDWIKSIKKNKSNTGQDVIDVLRSKFTSNDDEEQRKSYDKEIHMDIYNTIYYLKNELLENLNKQFSIKLIGFYKTPYIFNMYDNIFDYNLRISQFTRAHILYYIQANKAMNKAFIRKKTTNLDIHKLYNVMSNKIDYVKKNDNINLFKCFFKYYYRIQNHEYDTKIKKNKTKKKHKKILATHQIIWDTLNMNEVALPCKKISVFNMLTNLKNFKYIKKYKYFLSQKNHLKSYNKKRNETLFSIFFYLHWDISKNVLYRISKYCFSIDFIKQYISTLLKKNIRISRKYKNIKKYNRISRYNTNLEEEQSYMDNVNICNDIIDDVDIIVEGEDDQNECKKKNKVNNHNNNNNLYSNNMNSNNMNSNNINSNNINSNSIYSNNIYSNNIYSNNIYSNNTYSNNTYSNNIHMMRKRMVGTPYVNKYIIKCNTLKKDNKLHNLRKRFLYEINKYEYDSYNIFTSEKVKKNPIHFYFNKFNMPSSLLIYGTDGVGKTTLMKFIIQIILSRYKHIFMKKSYTLKERDINLGYNVFTSDRKITDTKYLPKEFSYDSYGKNIIGTNHLKELNLRQTYIKKMRKSIMKEMKNIYYEFKNVSIIPFENHLLVNKTIGENTKYIKNIFYVAYKNQPSVIIFDNIDLFLEKNNYYKHQDLEDQNQDVYKNIYNLFIHYLSIYINDSNKIKFVATTRVHPKYFKFSFLNKIEKIMFLS